MIRRWLALLSIVAVLVHGAFACSNDDALNPQPLPPGEGNDVPGSAGSSSSSGGGPSAGGSSSSSGGSSTSGEPAPTQNDGGDAGDAGDAGGDQ